MKTETPILPGLAEPPTSEVELCDNDLIDLCEQVKREGRFIAVLEVVKGNRWRAVIRRLPAPETRTPLGKRTAPAQRKRAGDATAAPGGHPGTVASIHSHTVKSNQTRKRGRRTKKNRQTLRRLAELIRRGCSLKVACQGAGISCATLFSWLASDTKVRKLVQDAKEQSGSCADPNRPRPCQE